LPVTAADAVSLAPLGRFDDPIFVTSAPEDPSRLFVAERGGVVRVDEGGSASTFADLSALVSYCAGERGLLSIAPAARLRQLGLPLRRLHRDRSGRRRRG
jgi:hypothetical protein